MSQTLVKTTSGLIEGFEKEGILAFNAIPYCQPPTGERRFQKADPRMTWEGVFEARGPGFICPQGKSTLTPAIGSYDVAHNENCLTLDIRTPSVTGKKPVAVWIHGGANCFGGGNLPCYDATTLAKAGDIVIVNINFRLGAFGFLHHPAISTVNLAIKDQITALRWIKTNIEAFGGDPDEITLFGQSAGANAIIHLVGLKETQGLFHRVILQSPSIGRGNFKASEALEIGKAMIQALGVEGKVKETIRQRFMTATSQEILGAMKAIRETCVPKFGNMLFKPVKDEWDTPQRIIEVTVTEAKARNLHVMIGTTHDEMHGFTLERSDKVRAIQEARFDGPANALAKALNDAGVAVWKYRFDWKAPLSPYDSCHCIELPFVFGTWGAWDDAGMLNGMTEDDRIRLTDVMQTTWIRFIREGRFDENDWRLYQKESDLRVFL
ncbi:MAG: carboxylesterase/lipase family protein [Burkholderiaceae bacterium]|nr:carboxylesterase/lipase family protein [Burkholderiaceae bacterium]